MPEKTVRPIRSQDFPLRTRMMEEVFGSSGEGVLGPDSVRLCCEFFSDACFVAFEGEEPAGYALSFVRGEKAYSTTPAVASAHWGTRVTGFLIRALIARTARASSRSGPASTAGGYWAPAVLRRSPPWRTDRAG